MKFKTYNIQAIAITNNHLPEIDVPCGDCKQCCILLSPNLTQEEFESGKYIYTFLNSPNGIPTISIPKTDKGCLYFIDNNCSIYNDRPIACKQFDCREDHYPPLKGCIK